MNTSKRQLIYRTDLVISLSWKRILALLRERRQIGELVGVSDLDGTVQRAVDAPRAADIAGRCIGNKAPVPLITRPASFGSSRHIIWGPANTDSRPSRFRRSANAIIGWTSPP